MNSKSLLPLAIAAILLGQGCHSDKSPSGPSTFAAQVSKLAPGGWRVSTSNDLITLRREAPVWIMGYVSRPPQLGTKEEFFKSYSKEFHYELRLRFVPLLSRSEYERLRAARVQAAERLKQGASGKSEYAEFQKHYKECQVPLYFTEHYSVFVDRRADIDGGTGCCVEPLFVEVYPPEAASEIDDVVRSFRTVFSEYANPGS